ETTGARYLRKSKENPFIPIGAFATVGAFVMSVIKWREGNSLHMQYWMRARVGLQASTVAAFVIGAWLLGETKQQRDARAQAENEAQAVREQAEFRERMKAAEEAQRLE
ncbi:hypoxia induced protein conserved region-domain-containing protein, partial [Rhodofomes roseus]